MNLQQIVSLNLFKNSQFPGTSYQEAYFYDANDLLQYAGFAPRSSATSAAVWIVVKFTYTATGNVSTVQTSPLNSILDNRGSLTYA